MGDAHRHGVVAAEGRNREGVGDELDDAPLGIDDAQTVSTSGVVHRSGSLHDEDSALRDTACRVVDLGRRGHCETDAPETVSVRLGELEGVVLVAGPAQPGAFPARFDDTQAPDLGIELGGVGSSVVRSSTERSAAAGRWLIHENSSDGAMDIILALRYLLVQTRGNIR